MKVFGAAAQLPLLVLALVAAGLARAEGARAVAPAAADSGRLLLTQGVSDIEGAAGGGLASWAVISGYGTRDAIGGNAHVSHASLPDFDLLTYGTSIGLFDRVELSFARQDFDTGATGEALGLGAGFTFHQDVVGVKVKLIGDAVYGQNSLLPQLAVGAQFKHNEQGAIVHAVGGRYDDGVDIYLSATKILLDQNLVIDATVRFTKANQIGILGFGGDLSDRYHPRFEGSIGYLLTRRLVVGGEYRTKSSNLKFAREDDWLDAFAAYAINKHLSVTLAYLDLGSIATVKSQRGVFVSLQAGF